MLVRTPTDDTAESNSFYQEAYSQEYTTDCPAPEDLRKLIDTNFEGTDRDYTRYVKFFRFLNVSPDARVLDFGCSWGYGLFQFRKAGYNAEGFEVSLPRAQYGKEKMSLPISSSIKDINGKFDVIFSSHVLEHLPDFSGINELYKNHLSDNGLFIAVTPNGSEAFRKDDYTAFHQIWGKVHPVLINDRFVKKNFGKELIYMDSWKSMTPEFKTGSFEPALEKFELVYVLKARV
jgi:2-polyprenyl-3-methyl-5-hydroxy-6-metoxy-1,4-benzoquinol methylase